MPHVCNGNFVRIATNNLIRAIGASRHGLVGEVLVPAMPSCRPRNKYPIDFMAQYLRSDCGFTQCSYTIGCSRARCSHWRFPKNIVWHTKSIVPYRILQVGRVVAVAREPRSPTSRSTTWPWCGRSPTSSPRPDSRYGRWVTVVDGLRYP